VTALDAGHAKVEDRGRGRSGLERSDKERERGETREVGAKERGKLWGKGQERTAAEAVHGPTVQGRSDSDSDQRASDREREAEQR